MKLTTLFRIGLMAVVGAVLSVEAPAQVPVPLPDFDVPQLSSAELDQLLGPIALYPDPLIAQILPAATLPSQVVLADRYVIDGGDVNQIDQQPWDDSIKALVQYPVVLKMMDDNLEWTTELGQVFVNQQADAMDSIQRLRAQAQALGNLQSNPQQQVIPDDGYIDIVPANPEVIYVPVYDPEVIFMQRCPSPGFFMMFGPGFAVGWWFNHDCDWHNHHVIVWPHDHPRPPDWWHRPPSQRGHPGDDTTKDPGHHKDGDSNATVWHPPKNRPGGPPANRSDRGWNAPEPHPQVPRVTRPVPSPAEPRKISVPTTRPTPITGLAPEAQSGPVSPRKISVPTVRPTPITQPAEPIRREAPARPERPDAGTLIGVPSARETREISTRGVESRQTITAPQPSAPTESQRSSDNNQRRQR